jgi:AraC-like DNA-binding protein
MQQIDPIDYGFLPRNPPPAMLERLEWPLDRLPKRRLQPIDLRSIRPVIHLAHRTTYPLVLPDRVILDHEIVLVLRGEGELVTESFVQSFVPGDLLVIPPYVPHRFVGRAEQFEHIAVHFDLTSPGSDLSDLQAREPCSVLLDDGSTLDAHDRVANWDPRRGRLESLVRNWADDTRLGTLKAEAALLDVVTSLIRVPPQERPVAVNVDRRIERALLEIERRLGEPPSVDELAQGADLGVSRFTRLFRERVGEPPAAYVNRVRLSRARQLLEDTETPVKAIALACGYRDPAHFSRAFFAKHGLWPSQQRQHARQSPR